jgi:hypothetical protein
MIHVPDADRLRETPQDGGEAGKVGTGVPVLMDDEWGAAGSRLHETDTGMGTTDIGGNQAGAVGIETW